MPEKKDKKTKEKVEMEAAEAPKVEDKKVKKSKKHRHVPVAHVYVLASYNNTIVSVAEPNGDIIAWASSGGSGFKGTRKSTPYAAQVAAETAAEKAKVFGVEKIHVFVKGVGNGREQSIRGLISKGLDLLSITDTTPIPHNGCRKKKPRRV